MKRIDDGHRLCNDLMNCIQERAKIEKSYSQQLTDWSKRWRQLIDKGERGFFFPVNVMVVRHANPPTLILSTPDSGPQYGTVERAWVGLMVEAEKISELHQEVKNRLVIDDFEKVKNWQKDSYHKQMMGGFKETKEAEEFFKKAQKPWAKKLKEVSARVQLIKLY